LLSSPHPAAPARGQRPIGETRKRRLGHATAADTYSHLWPDSDDRTREAIDAILGEVPPACPEDEAN
jgi:hypothetical protein